MTAPTPYTPPDGHIICLAADVPEGWEYRYTATGTIWLTLPLYAGSTTFVEARPVRQADPSYLTRFVVEGRQHWVTTVGEMRGRTDLDQWEYADTDPQSVGWTRFDYMHWDRSETTDDHPVIVRRVS